MGIFVTHSRNKKLGLLKPDKHEQKNRTSSPIKSMRNHRNRLKTQETKLRRVPNVPKTKHKNRSPVAIFCYFCHYFLFVCFRHKPHYILLDLWIQVDKTIMKKKNCITSLYVIQFFFSQFILFHRHLNNFTRKQDNNTV